MTENSNKNVDATSHSKAYDTSILKRKYKENPFVAEGRFVVPTRNRGERIDTAGPLALVDTSTGETTDVAEIRKITTVDSERFVKLFVGQLHAFYDLRPGTMKIMTALIDELSDRRYMNGDQIYLNYQQVIDYFEEHSSSAPAKSTYMRALAEMTEKGFIAPSKSPNLWFINPAIFFNGDRIRFVTEIRRKRKSRQEQLEERGQSRLPGMDRGDADE